MKPNGKRKRACPGEVPVTAGLATPEFRRRRVMARSMKLGHCVCDPRKPCPCPLFKEKKVCTCAGERLFPQNAKTGIRLTDHVRAEGCASKISQKDLDQVLRLLPAVSDPRLLVGAATGDDAGVFRLTPSVTVVQTVDVFTPGIDDPYLFGRIAACNSVSDIYAMGGTPATALSIIGFPIHRLPHEVMGKILRGGMDVLREAGIILLGGHSINDEEIKFGFAVTGLISDRNIITNAGAQTGDALILTKPLGTGIVSLAGRIGRASRESIEAMTSAMTALNRAASEIMVRRNATACTDVTGFGLIGHLVRMVMESRVTAEIRCDSLPLLPDVLEYAKAGMFSGANERNADFGAERVSFDSGVSEEMKAVLYDPQTSGGLLIAIPGDRAGETVEEMRAGGAADATVIGRVTEASEGLIRVLGKPFSKTPALSQTACCPAARLTPASRGNKETAMSKQEKNPAEECCAHGSSVPPGQAIKMFHDFLGAAMAPGAVDVVTKELIAIALGLAVHCVPCSRIHIKKAKEMGISAEEIAEAAALAVAFSGCRALMLWNELKKDLPANREETRP